MRFKFTIVRKDVRNVGYKLVIARNKVKCDIFNCNVTDHGKSWPNGRELDS